MRWRWCFLAIVWTALFAGCGPGKTVEEDSDPDPPDVEAIDPTEPKVDEFEELCAKLKVDPEDAGHERSEGKITHLYLNNTNVSDLSPLKGLPLTHLNLLGTRVADISVVKDLNLNTLWLNETRVEDISALKGKSLESLDLTGTPVTDVSALKGMTSLRRLRLSRSMVTDLSPLQGLQLERLVFDPRKITSGLDAVKQMKSLKRMHTRMQDDQRQFLSPEDFWKAHAAGTLPAE